MTFFAGHTGTVKLRRSTKNQTLDTYVMPDDVNLSLNRLGFASSGENILTGDRIRITTGDARKLAFFDTSAWKNTNVLDKSITLYTNVNIAGGLRFYRTFEEAINNTRASEIILSNFSGERIDIEVSILDVDFNILGSVTGFTLQTEREAIETTSLSDKFKQQYSAGLISGGGTIDTLFAPADENVPSIESSLFLLQIIQRIEIGSAFQAQLFLTDRSVYGSTKDVYYQMDAIITKAGVEVRSDNIVSCSIDFLAAGEIQLLVGIIPDSILDGLLLNDIENGRLLSGYGD